MRGQVRFATPLRFFFLLHLALSISCLAGCSGERTAAPLAPAAAGPGQVLTIWADGVQVAEIVDPVTIQRILDQFPVPPRNPNADPDENITMTRDPRIIAVIRELLPEEPMRSGFAGHIRHITWGELKVKLARR